MSNTVYIQGASEETYELPEPAPVPAFPSAVWVSLGMSTVELKRRFDVETRESGGVVTVEDDEVEVREGVLLMGDLHAE